MSAKKKKAKGPKKKVAKKKKVAPKKAKPVTPVPLSSTTLIFSGVRHDLEDFFRLTDTLTCEKRLHNAFIVITPAGLVTTERSAERLASQYEPQTQVLCQWPGKKRSDVFHFTVEEFKRRYFLKVKDEAQG
jgi:hypothetical protein